VLIGRHKDVERVDRLLAQAREGQSGALLVRGEPGIGKTALLEYARDNAKDMTVLVARGIESESELPYSGLSDLAGPLLGLRDRLPPAQSLALGQALALEEGGTPPRFAVPAALLGLLGTAAEDRPVLALVDDAQWIDAPSMEAIVFVARRLRDEGVAMLLAAREDLPPPAREIDAAGLEVLRLAPLAPGDAVALVRETHGDRVRGTVMADLVTAAAGNPLALLELPSALTEEQLSGREAMPPVLPPGESVAAAFRRRLIDLPEETRTALLVVAAGREEDLHQLAAAIRGMGLGPDALDPAEADGIIGIRQGQVRFRHPLLRAAAYHLASPPARRAAHRALAEGAPEGSPARAWHLAAAAAAADEDVARDLEAAALDARRRGGHASAARAFARAAELTPGRAERARRLMEAAVDSQIAGELDRAEGLCSEGLENDPDPMVAALLHRVRASVMIRSGRPANGLAEMVDAAGRLEPAMPVASAAMLLEAALAQLASGPVGDAVWMAERALELAGDEPTLGALADAALGEVFMTTGQPARAAEHLARSFPVLMENEPPPGTWDVVAFNAHASMWLEENERADRLLGRIIDRGRAEGALAQLAYPLAIRAQLAFRVGRWPQARADAEEAVRAAADTGQDTMLIYALGVRTHVEGMLGHADAAREYAAEALRLLGITETRVFAAYTQAGLGLVALAEGDARRAAEEFTAGLQAARGMGLAMPGQDICSPDTVEALVRAGDADGARRVYEELAELLTDDQPPTVHAQFARARALLALDDDPARHFADALDHHARGTNPFERARTELAFGDWLRGGGGSRTDAQTHLRAALETFERLGARPWAERARDALRGTGIAQRREDVPIAEVLTPHELQVAMVVAQGATNKEAAAALFLSPKTVEHHLGQIYRKLQLRSRTELAALVTGAAA
jgi:DNA-binding NarL/FixJ family response regulator